MNQVDRLAGRIRNLEKEVRSQAATPQLAHSSIEDGSLKVNDRDGNLTMVIGKQFDGSQTATTLTGPVPPQPTAPTSRPGVSSVVAIWDGNFVDATFSPLDFARVEVHVGPPDLNPLTATYLRGTIESPRGGEVVVPVDGTDPVTIVLVARSLAGRYGPASEPTVETPSVIDVNIEPNSITAIEIDNGAVGETEIADDAISTPKLQVGAVTAQAIPANAVEADKIAANAVTAGKIAANAVEADKISANAVTAGKIAANAVEADKIAANSITGAKLAVNIALASRFVSGGTQAADGTFSGQRVELSNLGLQAYDATGNVTFKVSNDGTAHTFSGSADVDYGRFSKGFSLGGAGEIAQGGTMVVATGTTAPSIPATLYTRSYGTYYSREPAVGGVAPVHGGSSFGNLPTVFMSTEPYAGRANGGFGYVDETTNSTYIGYWITDASGTFLGTRISKFTHVPGTPPGLAGNEGLTWVSNEDFPGQAIIGYVKRTNVVAWLTASTTTAGPSTTYTLSSNGNDGGGTVVRTYTRRPTNVYTHPGFGWDKVNNKILVTEWDRDSNAGGDNFRVVQRFGVGSSPDGTTWTSAYSGIRPNNNGPLAVHYGRFDFSEDVFVFSDAGYSGGADFVDVYTGIDGSQLSLGRRFPTGGLAGSTCWDGQVFRTMLGYPTLSRGTSPGFMVVHSKETDESTTTPGYFPWWVGLSYVRKVSGSIVYETVLGAKSRISVAKRGYLIVQAPPSPGTSANGPTDVRVYLGKETVASTSPADSAYREDGTAAYNSSIAHTPEIAVGTAPLTTGTFPGGAGGSLFSAAQDTLQAALIKIAGDGSWRLGDLKGDTLGKNNIWEAGDLKHSFRTTPTAGWLLCDGSIVSQTTYPALFAAIGHSANGGVQPSAGNFKLPDLRDRSVIGSSSTRALGSTGGAATVSLTGAQNGPHSHGGTTGVDSPDHAHLEHPELWRNVGGSKFNNPTNTGLYYGTSSQGGAPRTYTDGANTRHQHSIPSDGSGTAHENMSPYQAGNVFIKT